MHLTVFWASWHLGRRSWVGQKWVASRLVNRSAA